MNPIILQILEKLNATKDNPGFLDVLFGDLKQEAMQGTPVVLFGAGGLGAELCNTLRSYGIAPVCFCDNDATKNGSFYCGIPVIYFQDLQKTHRNSLIIIASHKYLTFLTDQLLASGFDTDRIFCKKSDETAPLVFMYAMIGTQHLFDIYHKQCGTKSVLDTLVEHEQLLLDAYPLFADDHSRGLFVSKLALMASDRNFALFSDFITSYSQPVLEFGFGNYDGTPEDYYYFNNDVITLAENEVYVDVGAYDGDTVQTFVEACTNFGVNYKRIHAFEPDPNCYNALLKNSATYRDVFCYQMGVWSSKQTLRFKTSESAIHDQAGTIDNSGNMEIQVVSLDDCLNGEKVSFIKMDPGGDVIPVALLGAAKTIATYRPKLALGAYHSIKSMFEIPILVNKLCPEYRLYLRHNTYHLCDTDLYAIV